METFTSPDYPSGHAAGVSSCNEILLSVFGNDLSFTISAPELPDNIHHYEHLTDLTQEAQNSRVYEGIHFRFAVEAGAELGKRLSQHALRNVLVPLVPDFAGAADQTGGGFQITLRSQASLPYVIETSSDLKSWTPWQTNAFGVLRILDESAAGSDRRFYRTVAR